MPTIRWSNGRSDFAPTWEGLEQKVRDDQWWDFTPDEFRIAMQKRARLWSSTEISTVGTSEEFFAELARAKLIVIEPDGSDPKERF